MTESNQETGRVDVHDPHEVLYWARRFEVSTDDLFTAIARVGSEISALETYFSDRNSLLS